MSERIPARRTIEITECTSKLINARRLLASALNYIPSGNAIAIAIRQFLIDTPGPTAERINQEEGSSDASSLPA